MPKTVTVRFYQVGLADRRSLSLRQALDEIEARGAPGLRERQLAAGIRVRLERYVTTPGLLTGEITRVRDDDHPSEVHPHGTTQLNVAGPIGEGIAFQYRERDHVLAIQYDVRTVAPSRFIEYIMALVQNARFTFEPKADANALRHFRARPLRKAKVRLASPQDLRNVEPAMASVARSVRSLSRDYGAPTITLELGMGHEDGSLGQDAKRMIEGFVRRAGADDNIKSVKATPDNGVGIENAEVNLLDALLSVKHTINRPSNDPVQNYVERSRIVQAALNAHV
ncbi:hypothetical protein JW805_04075 [Roseomonas aeriglobus]|nr:hypothetical protein [Roseomonas aeriglobus]